MTFKFVFALAFVAVASAGYAPVAQVYSQAAPLTVGHNVVVKAAEEYDPHPQYRFAYGVDDKLTGDSKSHIEERDGDVVRGEYSLIDADGYKRTVHYTADDVNGFNAVVERQPLVKSIAVAPVAVKSIAAPVISYASAPVAHYSAPIARYAAPAVVRSYAAPVAHYAAPAAHYTSYAAPSVVKSAPLTYAAPAAHYAAPASHYTSYAAPNNVNSAPLSYAAPAAHYASYSAPAFSYHH